MSWQQRQGQPPPSGGGTPTTGQPAAGSNSQFPRLAPNPSPHRRPTAPGATTSNPPTGGGGGTPKPAPMGGGPSKPPPSTPPFSFPKPGATPVVATGVKSTGPPPPTPAFTLPTGPKPTPPPFTTTPQPQPQPQPTNNPPKETPPQQPAVVPVNTGSPSRPFGQPRAATISTTSEINRNSGGSKPDPRAINQNQPTNNRTSTSISPQPGSRLSGGGMTSPQVGRLQSSGSPVGSPRNSTDYQKDEYMPYWEPSQNYGTAIFAFTAKGEHQISLGLGEKVKIQERTRDGNWFRGVGQSSGNRGIFPSAFIAIASGDNRESRASTNALLRDPAIKRLNEVIAEWNVSLKKTYQERRYTEFQSLKDRLLMLLADRKRILSPQFNEVERQRFIEKTFDKIEESKRLMGLDVVVTTATGEPATPSNTGIFELLDMHLELTAKDQKHDVLDTTASSDDVSTSNSSARAAARRQKRRMELGKDTSVSAPKLKLFQLLLDYKAFICGVEGEEVSLYFSLYNERKKRFSEEYEVNLTALGMPKQEDKPASHLAVFKDLPSKEMEDLWLIVRVIRNGVLKWPPKKGKKDKEGQSKAFRRPFAVGVLQLSDEVFASKGEQTIKLWKWKGTDECAFGKLYETIINGGTLIEEIPKSVGVVASVARFEMPFSQFAHEYPEYAEAGVVNTLSLPENISPGEQRNDFYVTLVEGDFQEFSNMNVEVIVTVRMDNGKLIQKAISTGTSAEGIKSIYKSFVVYRSNSPVWNETMRISLTAEQFQSAHLHINLRHCTSADNAKDKGGFAYTFLKLCENDGTVTANGDHQLMCYKNPKTTDDMVFYLKGTEEKYHRKGEKGLTIRTLLASGVLTQNSALQSLLHWKETDDPTLTDTLKRITFVDQIEIMKFLKEIFDAMFAILDEKPNFSTLVYNALIFIIGILVDERTAKNFRSVLDGYIETHFAGKTAYKTLLTCLLYYLEKLDSNNMARLIRDSMKALEYIFKFVIASRILNLQAPVTPATQKDDEDFRRLISQAFTSFNALMSQTAGSLIASQTIALKNFAKVFHDMCKIYHISELADMACTLANSVPYEEAKKQLSLEKLGFLHELVAGSFYRDAEARQIMMPHVLNILSLHLDKSVEETIECVEILGVLLDCMQIEFGEADRALCLWELVPLLPLIMSGAQSVSSSNAEQKYKIAACVLSYFDHMEPYMYEQYIDYLEDKESFLLSTIKIMSSFIQDCFPNNWFVLCMLQFSTTLKVIKSLLPHLKPNYSKVLWTNYYKLCFALLNVPLLQLENFDSEKQEKIRSTYGDIRVEAAKILTTTWQTNAESFTEKSEISAYIKMSLEMLLVSLRQVKDMGIDFYINVLMREYKATSKFDDSANTTIDLLDTLASKVGTDLADLLIPKLTEKFKGTDQMCVQGNLLVKDLSQLLALLNALRALPEDPAYEDERVLATMKLIKYLKETGRVDSYIKYVHLLAQQHLLAKHYTEAAITILLHADLLDWSSTPLAARGPPSPFPSQQMSERKELLFRLAIDYFDKGRSWEEALPLIHSLKENVVLPKHDYKEMANLLRKEATFYENIVETERFYPEYFRVGYYGKGFPSTLQGKEFIYRGTELERLGDFIKRIQTKFPSAELLKSTDMPPAEIINSSGQHLLITPVTPSSEAEMSEDFSGEPPRNKKPYQIRTYEKYNNVKVFLYARAYNNSTTKKQNEFADMWIKKLFLTTEGAFPNVHRSLLVVKRTETESPPIQNAIKTISDKTDELEIFVEKYSAQKGLNCNPFTMALTGVVDAAVGGGVAKYQEAFLSGSFSSSNPKAGPLIQRLRIELERQVDVLEKAVALHRSVIPDGMQGLQQHLEESFEKMRASIKQ